MARRSNGQQAPAAPQGAAGANDLEILQPDRVVTIAGQVITVHEYRFFEGLRIRALSAGFFNDLYALFKVGGAAPSFDDVTDLLVDHEDAVVAMVAQASDCDPEWIRGLDDQDGDALMVAWWLTNAGFFIRRVMRRAAEAHLAKRPNPSAGPASSTSSSPPDTSAGPTTSPA